jgi:hypothetical protein
MILIDFPARPPQRTTAGSGTLSIRRVMRSTKRRSQNAISFVRFAEGDLTEIGPTRYLSGKLWPEASNLQRGSAGL